MPGGNDSSSEKTEKASPKKRQDERKKGNIFLSKDIITLASMITSFFTLQFFIGPFLNEVQENYHLQITRAATVTELGTGDMMQIFMECCVIMATTILPVMLIVGAVSVAAALFQTRFLVAYEQIKFKLERISIIKGFKKLFSLRSLVELLKSMIKITVITWLLFNKVRAAMGSLLVMIDWDISQATSFAGEQILSLVVSVAIAFGAIAALDYLYQWWEYEKGIRMSKQEVKDEYKQMEGNPEIKGARRQKQREFAMNRMMQQVKESDVIVRNPTHFAVALKYTLEVDPAPIILAKGQDLIAQKIIDEAEKYNISMVENPPLARGLYDLGNINEAIPAEFYQPVAELLAWLYSTKEKDNQSL